MRTRATIESVPDLAEQVHQRLLDAICAGDLAPNARLRQEELAASFGVSRQPVLQALRLLRTDGFVIEAGRRGLMVAPLDPQMIAQVYEVRGVLDGLAARLAARAAVKIDAALIVQGRKAVAGTRVSAMIEADLKFHNMIYRASGNRMIAEAAGRHWRHIRRAMGAALQAVRVRPTVWNEHAAILDAINCGDAALAERLARGHADSAGENLASELEREQRAAPPLA